MSNCQVLIVGAGPVGLVLAIMLSMLGVDFRIIDKRGEKTNLLRALAITKATEEIFSSLGIMELIYKRALAVPTVQVEHHLYGSVMFDYLDSKLNNPYYLHIYQPDIEGILIARLQDLGVAVQRSCELIDFQSLESHVEVKLQTEDGIDELNCNYIIGCDGVNSTVRHILGIKCEEESYNGSFFIVDVVAQADNNFQNTHFYVNDNGYLAVIPGTNDRLRIIQSFDSDIKNVTVSQDYLEKLIKEKLGRDLKISTIEWEAKSHFRHQIASSGQKGRAFLAGDSYHVFSPIAGFNMNFGFQDAKCLSQYLSDAILGNKANVSSGYELERKVAIIKLMKFTRLMSRMMIQPKMRDKLWRLFFSQVKGSVSFRRSLMQRFSGLSEDIY